MFITCFSTNIMYFGKKTNWGYLACLQDISCFLWSNPIPISPILSYLYHFQGHGLFSLVWDWDNFPDCSNFAFHWKTWPATAGYWRSHQGEYLTLFCVWRLVTVVVVVAVFPKWDAKTIWAWSRCHFQHGLPLENQPEENEETGKGDYHWSLKIFVV